MKQCEKELFINFANHQYIHQFYHIQSKRHKVIKIEYKQYA